MRGWRNSIKAVNTNTTTKSYVRHSLKMPFVGLAKIANISNFIRKTNQQAQQ